MLRLWIVPLLLAGIASTTRADDDSFKKAVEAFKKQDLPTARKEVEAAIKADPKREEAYHLLGMVCLQQRDNEPAVAAYRKALELNPKSIVANDRMGDALLKLGKFKESVEAFDKVLALKPEFAPEHWRRGIALYYAGKFADGAKQFETHKTANPQDVENAAWHYLCNSKVNGKEKARSELIDVTKDTRIPMAEIQKLFAGKLKPEDVMKRAEETKAGTEEGTEARFYGHLYVALWYEAEGDSKKVFEHLTPAVEKYKIGHYMWDVANAHLALLKKKP